MSKTRRADTFRCFRVHQSYTLHCETSPFQSWLAIARDPPGGNWSGRQSTAKALALIIKSISSAFVMPVHFADIEAILVTRTTLEQQDLILQISKIEYNEVYAKLHKVSNTMSNYHKSHNNRKAKIQSTLGASHSPISRLMMEAQKGASSCHAASLAK